MPVKNREANEHTIFGAIVDWAKTHNYSPSFRELAEVTGLPLGTCHALSRELRAEGRITYEDNTARSIRIVE